MEIVAEVAKFCRARKAVSYRSTTVPQVALVFSAETMWDRCETPFDPEPAKLFDELQGMLHALLELHYSVDILSEHQIESRLNEFPVVVISYAYKLPSGFKEKLLTYVNEGGALLVAGHEGANLFRDDLGVLFEGEPEELAAPLRTSAGMANAGGVWQKVSVKKADVITRRCKDFMEESCGEAASTIAECGKGKIGAIYGPVSIAHFKTHHPYTRAAIGDIMGKLFPVPAVEVDTLPCVDIALRRTADGRLSLHLLNLANAQRSPEFIAVEDIPELGPIKVQMDVPERPSNVLWIPDGGKIDWSWRDGKLTSTIPSIHIHGVLVVE